MDNVQYLRGAIDASDCVGQAWELVKRNFGLYIGAGLVTIVFISCIPIANFFLIGPMMGGFAYIVLRDLRNEPIEFGMLFKGFEKFVPLMVLGLIQAIPGIAFQIIQYTVDVSRLFGALPQSTGGADFYQAGDSPLGPLQAGFATGLILLFLVYFVFQILWNATLTFAIPLMIEKNVSIGDAITLSIGAVFSNLGGLILLVILSFLVGLLGLLALCVGVLVAIPVTWAAYVIAYRQVFPDLRPSTYSTGPPPPDVYGFGGGPR